MTGVEKYALKNKRLDDAIHMEKPDMVPLAPMDETFGIAYAGHTMAEGMYNYKVFADAQRKLMDDFDLDICTGPASYYAGYGPAFDEMGLKMLQWAGQKGSVCTDMSTHQYVEKSYMGEDDYPALLADMSGYMMSKILPQVMSCAAPLANVSFAGMFGIGAVMGTMQFADPNIAEAFTRLHKAGSTILQVNMENAAFEESVIEAGYPLMSKGATCTAFDLFSDCLRGTLGISEDMIVQPEMVEAAVNIFHHASVQMALSSAAMGKGKFVMIPLHKGIDMFMNDTHYGRFYWPTLKLLVEAVVNAGYTPYIITEGKYYSRLKYLEQLPAHKCVIAFTNMDMKIVKESVGKYQCITGGFNEHILQTGTPEQVKDEVKRILDICAPDGGYIFAVDRTLDYMARPENVEAMCDAVRIYGKY